MFLSFPHNTFPFIVIKSNKERIIFTLLEVYRNTVTGTTITVTRTKDSGTKKLAATNHPFTF